MEPVIIKKDNHEEKNYPIEKKYHKNLRNV